MKDNHIQYIEFKTTDLKKMKEFYSKAFGWTFIDYGDNYTAFEVKNSGVSGGFERVEKVTPGGPASTRTTSLGGPLVVLFHNKLETAKENVVKGGGIILKDIFSFPGGRRFHFTDPSNNELAVWSDK